MPPIIHFVRHAQVRFQSSQLISQALLLIESHGQGTHNISLEHSHIPDPTITEKGIEQCQELQRDFPRHSHVDLVVSSPFRRTLYTALKAFEPVFTAHPERKILLHPDLQEISDFSCDVGSERVALESEIQENRVPADMSLVSDGWQLKVSRLLPYFLRDKHQLLVFPLLDASISIG